MSITRQRQPYPFTMDSITLGMQFSCLQISVQENPACQLSALVNTLSDWNGFLPSIIEPTRKGTVNKYLYKHLSFLYIIFHKPIS